MIDKNLSKEQLVETLEYYKSLVLQWKKEADEERAKRFSAELKLFGLDAKTLTTEDKKLTEEGVRILTERLRAHFQQPVMPISQYCDALKTWEHCMWERMVHLSKELYPSGNPAALDEELDRLKERQILREEPTERDFKLQKLKHYQEVSEQINYVFLQIRKSALLDRLLYVGEKLRTKRCPKHDGVWSGLFGTCEHNCELTGWIREPAMVEAESS